MERFVKGTVVIVPFLFSDLSSTKKRPALVLAQHGEDIVLVQLTSKQSRHTISVKLKEGHLPSQSYVKVHRLFSADKSIILRVAGRVTSETIRNVEHSLQELLISPHL